MPNTTFQNLPYPAPTDPVDVPGDIQALAEALDTKMLDKAVIGEKGEILCGLADNTVTVVPKGTNDQVLIADSTATPGAKWAQIGSNNMASAAVTTAKIADAAVTTAKIADANVTTAKIADSNVTTGKIADANVTTAKIADGNVTTAKIADGNVTTAKIAAANVTADKLASGVAIPSGVVNPYAGASAPTGWLLCDGSAVSRSTYSALFAVLGTTYGTGDGSTTFNVPNMKGRVPVGLDSTQTEFDVRGETGGAKTHTLSTTEMPSHTHAQTGHAHGGGSHAHAGPSHTHTINHGHSASQGSAGGHDHQVLTKINSTGAGSTGRLMAGNTSGTDSWIVTPAGQGTHDHSVSVGSYSGNSGSDGSGSTTSSGITTDTQTPTIAAAGSGGAHNNLQPYLVLNYIIKT